jgi:hypothetical protein
MLQGREANHSPSSSAKVKNGSYTSTPQYVFNHNDNMMYEWTREGETLSKGKAVLLQAVKAHRGVRGWSTHIF